MSTAEQSPYPAERPGFKAELWSTAKLAGPLVLSFVGYQTITLVDTFVAGQIGVEALAAVSLGGALYWAINIFPLGLLIGLDPIISQSLGRGEERRSWSALEQGLGLALLMSLLTAPIYFALTRVGLPWSPAGAVSDELGAYAFGRIWSILPLLIHTCLRCFLQGHERTQPILWGTALANLLNIPLSAYLGGGDQLMASLGLPQLGLLTQGYGAIGIGVASSVVSSIEVLFLLWVTTRLSGRAPRPRRGWRELIKLGAPIGGSMLSEGGVFSASTLIVSAWGPAVIGAHQVTLQLASYTFILCLGVSNATSVRVGRAVGRGDWARSRQATLAGLCLCLGVMSISASTFVSQGASLAGLISADREVVTLAAQLLMIAAAFQLFDGAQVVMAAALRGAGFTSIPLWSAVVSHWGVGLPLAYLVAFKLHYGVYGLWWGLSGGLLCAAIILSISFYRVTRAALERAPAAQLSPIEPLS